MDGQDDLILCVCLRCSKIGVLEATTESADQWVEQSTVCAYLTVMIPHAYTMQ